MCDFLVGSAYMAPVPHKAPPSREETPAKCRNPQQRTCTEIQPQRGPLLTPGAPTCVEKESKMHFRTSKFCKIVGNEVKIDKATWYLKRLI